MTTYYGEIAQGVFAQKLRTGQMRVTELLLEARELLGEAVIE